MNDKYKIFFEYYDITEGGQVISKRTNKKLKKQTNRYGYETFRACINYKKYTVYIHRAVALKYLNNPNNYPEINHIDGNKTNNNVDNLEWCSREHNIKHAFNTGLNNQKNKKRKVVKINPKTNEILTTFNSLTEAGEELGVRESSICGVCTGYRKTLHGFNYKYLEEVI